MSKSLLLEIEERLIGMSVSERRVAQLCLRNPQDFIRKSLLSISREVFVSKPTVIRFCQRLGFRSFSDLIDSLRVDVVEGVPYIHYGVSESFSTEQVLESICSKTIESIRSFRNLPLEDSFESCAIAISQSLIENKRVQFFGLGGSGFVAQDASIKLQRLGANASALTDSYMQIVGAHHLADGDTAVFISNSGQTIGLIDACQRAHSVRATTIAITKSDSKLYNASQLRLPLDHFERFELYCPMNSRHLQLIALDILTTCVSLKVNSEKLIGNLEVMSNALRQARIPK